VTSLDGTPLRAQEVDYQLRMDLAGWSFFDNTSFDDEKLFLSLLLLFSSDKCYHFNTDLFTCYHFNADLFTEQLLRF
jgi:hypothetical protein